MVYWSGFYILMAMQKIIFLFLLLSFPARAEIVVIGNIKNTHQQLTQLQVQDIFMGRSRSFPNGTLAYPLDQKDLRDEFYLKLTNRPIAQINAYWARLKFSGQTFPPIKVSDDQSMLKAVHDYPGAIGYIDKKNVDEAVVRILFILE